MNAHNDNGFLSSACNKKIEEKKHKHHKYKYSCTSTEGPIMYPIFTLLKYKHMKTEDI